ncbi:hypothetical protein [Vibrio astriarenae]|nr:hypothetical protein [Vibrio astriarenae]
MILLPFIIFADCDDKAISPVTDFNFKQIEAVDFCSGSSKTKQ